jgi:hypothetical protein
VSCEDSLHAVGQAACEGVEACCVGRIRHVCTFTRDVVDREAGERPKTVGQPCFRVMDAGEIDLRRAGAMAGTLWPIRQLDAGV